MNLKTEKHSAIRRRSIGFGKYAFLTILIMLFLIGISSVTNLHAQEKTLFDNQDTSMIIDYRVGWTTVSIPVGGSPIKLSDLSIGIKSAFAFNDGNKKPYSQVTQLIPGRSYWVNFTSYSGIQYFGLKRLQASVPVRAGWNFIPSLSRRVPKEKMTLIPEGGVYVMMGPDPTGVWLRNAQAMYPGFGYWVNASNSGILLLVAD